MLDGRYALTVSLNKLIELNVLYEGYDTLEGEFVWLKFISPTEHMRSGFISHYIDERTVVDNIDCPYLLKVRGVGRTVIGGVVLYYIVSEYSKGVLLADMIEGNYIHIEALVSIATQIVKCLALLHNNGMYHGSLNPSNIIVDKDYNVKLMEVGTTKANGAVHMRDSVGRYYLSPSQININHSDFESDYYVLGAILFKVIFNRLPYDTYNTEVKMLSSMDRGVQWHLLTPYHMEANSALVDIVRKLLNRTYKYGSTENILIDLSNVLYDNANLTECISE